ncbi:MAG: 2-amino-4-hydroxy-6-hydroxymethyldihydropteridine diphosphokinase [Candidatus Hydrogenedentes bacterium]|nr:2-amino-4-hydroxy-6-hydroxymethyldihydropteridine diphosphokinase [Candidatus Hydrogenedentota bacterium]
MPAEGGQTEVLLAIGSNITPESNVPRALALLKESVFIVSVSTFYRSAALGAPGQPEFLNGACRIRTGISARDLKFDVLRGIEARLGRIRTADKYAPRAIDFDIALYGNTIVCEPGLHIPDPDIQHRPFLAVPLAEIAPDWVVAGTTTTLREIAAGLPIAGLCVDPDVTEACRRIVAEESRREH